MASGKRASRGLSGLRLHVCAVGRLRAGPERDLTDDYYTRFDRTGRPLGLGPVTELEVEDKKNLGMAAEAVCWNARCPPARCSCTLDERGRC